MKTELKIGQTWQLGSGGIVTITEPPDVEGWVTAVSHETGYVGVYADVRFGEDATLIEVRKRANDDLLEQIRQVVREELARHIKP